MDIRLCVPSYRRPYVRTLKRYPSCSVFVDGSEVEDYRAENTGARIVPVPDGVQGNLCRVRNHILDVMFEDGADAVVLLDDDYDYVGEFVDRLPRMGWDRRKLDEDELFQLCEDAAELADGFGVKMFGVNCVGTMPNSYMRNRPFSLTTYLGGPFQGFLRNPLRYDEDLYLKEDYDMCLQQAREYGGLLRLNYAFTISDQACKNRTKLKAGGCSMQRNTLEERRQFERLQAKWGPDVVRTDKGSKRGFDYNPIIRIPIQGV